MVKRKAPRENDDLRLSTEESGEGMDDSGPSTAKSTRRVRKKTAKVLEMEEFEDELVKAATKPTFSVLPKILNPTPAPSTSATSVVSIETKDPQPSTSGQAATTQVTMKPLVVDTKPLVVDMKPQHKSPSPVTSPKMIATPVVHKSPKDIASAKHTSKFKSRASISGKVEAAPSDPTSPKKAKVKQMITTSVKPMVIVEDDDELPESVIKLLLGSPKAAEKSKDEKPKPQIKKNSKATIPKSDPIKTDEVKDVAHKVSVLDSCDLDVSKMQFDTPVVVSDKQEKKTKDVKTIQEKSNTSHTEKKIKMKFHLGDKPSVEYKSDDSKSMDSLSRTLEKHEKSSDGRDKHKKVQDESKFEDTRSSFKGSDNGEEKKPKIRGAKLESLDDHAFASILQSGDTFPEKVVKKKSKKKTASLSSPPPPFLNVKTTNVGVTAVIKHDKPKVIDKTPAAHRKEQEPVKSPIRVIKSEPILKPILVKPENSKYNVPLAPSKIDEPVIKTESDNKSDDNSSKKSVHGKRSTDSISPSETLHQSHHIKKEDHSTKEDHSEKEDHSMKENHSKKEHHSKKEDHYKKEDDSEKEDPSKKEDRLKREDHIKIEPDAKKDHIEKSDRVKKSDNHNQKADYKSMTENKKKPESARKSIKSLKKTKEVNEHKDKKRKSIVTLSASESEQEDIKDKLIIAEEKKKKVKSPKVQKLSKQKSPKVTKPKKAIKTTMSSPEPMDISFDSQADDSESESPDNNVEVAQLAMKLKTSKEKKTVKPRKTAADKDKKKRPPTAYMMFCANNRNKVMQESPGMDFAEISRALGEMWKSATNKDKMSWRSKARKANSAAPMISTGKAGGRTTGPPPPPGGKAAVKPVTPTARTRKASGTIEPDDSPSKIFGNEPIDVAAHLKLLGESLSIIGMRLQEHKGLIAVQGSLSVLLDSVLCAFGPLVCLTQCLPESNGCPKEVLSKTLDNIAYIMPGL